MKKLNSGGGAKQAARAAHKGGGGAEAARKAAHGGKRAGAGRPQKYGCPTKSVLITLPEPLIRALDRAVQAGIAGNRSELVVHTLERSVTLRPYRDEEARS